MTILLKLLLKLALRLLVVKTEWHISLFRHKKALVSDLFHDCDFRAARHLQAHLYEYF
jgi:hypothetical protein